MLSFDNIMPKMRRKLSLHHTQTGLESRCFGMLRFVEDKPLAKWQAQLARAQTELAQLGPMRPGSLSQQFKDPAAKTGAYWQLSYTHKMRSRTRYVRPEEVTHLKPLLANFKRFRELVDQCVDLSVQIADRQTELRRADSGKSR